VDAEVVDEPESRRWDGEPETEKDAKFFDLRDAGYRGPIDQDGNAVEDGDLLTELGQRGAVLVPRQPAAPMLSAAPVAALTTGTTGGHMTNHATTNTADSSAAESGLDAYLGFAEKMSSNCTEAVGSTEQSVAYAQDMSDNCAQAVSDIEATLSAMRGQDWQGVPVDAMQDAMEDLSAAGEEFRTAHTAYQNAMERLGTAASQFGTAHTALTASLNVRESYGANPHTGNKDSVNN